MILNRMSFDLSVRFTQEGHIDYELDAFRTTSYTVLPAMYQLLFLDMLNGEVTGVDNADPEVDCGFSASVHATTNATVLTTDPVAKMDWYETESSYFIEALMTKTGAFTPNPAYLNLVKLYYTANNSNVEQVYTLMTSTTPAMSSFSEYDTDPARSTLKGILVDPDDGNLTFSAKFTVRILK